MWSRGKEFALLILIVMIASGASDYFGERPSFNFAFGAAQPASRATVAQSVGFVKPSYQSWR